MDNKHGWLYIYIHNHIGVYGYIFPIYIYNMVMYIYWEHPKDHIDHP
jgi:hypothetical protein